MVATESRTITLSTFKPACDTWLASKATRDCVRLVVVVSKKRLGRRMMVANIFSRRSACTRLDSQTEP